MILAGFANPVLDGQSVFRATMNALARPGTIETVVGIDSLPHPLCPAMAALALALLDHETPVHLDPALDAADEVRAFLAFHTAAPLTGDPARAAFALVSDAGALPALDAFATGSDAYPDRSTTILLEVAALGAGRAYRLSGPGIRGEAELAVDGLPPDMVARLAANRGLFPRGVDLILTAGARIAALPRSTRVSEA